MRKEKKSRKGKIMWGLIYVTAFVVTFAVSAAVKMTYQPLAKKFSYQWDDSVGKIYSDLSYGDGEATNSISMFPPIAAEKATDWLSISMQAVLLREIRAVMRIC